MIDLLSVNQDTFNVIVKELPDALFQKEGWWDINGVATIIAGISLIISIVAPIISHRIEKRKTTEERKLGLIKTLILDPQLPKYHEKLNEFEINLQRIRNLSPTNKRIDPLIQTFNLDLRNIFQNFAAIDIQFYTELDELIQNLTEVLIENISNVPCIKKKENYNNYVTKPIKQFNKDLINKIYTMKTK